MKKDLVISGKIELTKKDLIKIVEAHLLKSDNVQIQKVLLMDKEMKKVVPFENMVCFVRQAKTDKVVVDKIFEPEQTKMVKTGFSRPNYGIGKLLKDILSDEKEHALEDILKNARMKYPKIEKKQLKEYLSRVEMVGPVVEDKGIYLRVPEK